MDSDPNDEQCDATGDAMRNNSSVSLTTVTKIKYTSSGALGDEG